MKYEVPRFDVGMIADLSRQIADEESKLPALQNAVRDATSDLNFAEARIANLKIKFTAAVKKVGLDKSTLDRAD